MKNFTIILTVFSVLLLLIGTGNIGFLFAGMGIAWIICLISLIKYLGKIRGIFAWILLTILPAIIESYGALKSQLFFPALIKNVDLNNWKYLIEVRPILTLLFLGVMFTAAIFLAHTIALYTPINRYGKKGYIILAALIMGASTLQWRLQANYTMVIRWFLIALITYGITWVLYSFKSSCLTIYKFAPITVGLVALFAWSVSASQLPGVIVSLILAVPYAILMKKSRRAVPIQENPQNAD